MEFGHICFSVNHKSFTAKVIKFFTRSRWSHSFITAPPIIKERLMVLEATGEGVTSIPLDVGYLEDPTEDCIIFKVKIDDNLKIESINNILNSLQTGYGFLELPWFAWRGICYWFGKDIKSQDNWSQAGIICSELASNYLRGLGLGYLLEGFGKGSINAQDLYEICLNNPDIFELILDET